MLYLYFSQILTIGMLHTVLYRVWHIFLLLLGIVNFNDDVLFFRYLLEVAKPDPRTVLALLEILTRLARHSRDIAVAISYCPDLIAVLCRNFLPSKWGMYYI
jgi:hypothetical protein